jgi:hypothetical protein
MKFGRCRIALLACGSIVMTGMLCAQDVDDSESQNDDGTHAKGLSQGPGERQVIPHRTNQNKGALPAGSIGIITPTISLAWGPRHGHT